MILEAECKVLKTNQEFKCIAGLPPGRRNSFADMGQDPWKEHADVFITSQFSRRAMGSTLEPPQGPVVISGPGPSG